MAAGGDEGDLAGAAGIGPKNFILQKFKLYETRSKFYMIGWDKSGTIWRVLSLDREEPSELNMREDPTIYMKNECEDLLKRIDDGNKSSGGLRFVTQCYGIVGFVKLLGPYYLLLITKRRKIGSIYGHAIYAISKSEMIAIPNSTVRHSMAFSKHEERYKKLLCMVDLTKNFFFSYSYNIMRSLQRNLCDLESGGILYETMFVWNEFLTRGIRFHLKSTIWSVALVYGFFKQVKLSLSGKDFMFTLIARRSRHYAGTRYLKRGVNEKGRVANEVETEQIVFDVNARVVPTQISSVVQIRGSIPLFWSQDSSWLNMKPDIILQKDQKYEATRLHFDNLVKRYGNPIIIFNLIKTYERRARESILRAEFAKAINFINKDLPAENHLRFLHWDLSKHSQRATNILELLVRLGSNALNLTGFFYCQLSSLRLPGAMSSSFFVKETPEGIVDRTFSFEKQSRLQKGVLRTNCIDCLDRTNVAQFAYGLAALYQQLHLLGIVDVAIIDLDSPLSDEVMDIYEKMGDTLALQYGGSAAHNKIFCDRRGQWKAATQSQEIFRTVQRYYNNTYIDPLKQDAINVFLGYFQPQKDKAALWELDSDQHYNIGRGPFFVDEKARSFRRSLSEGNMICESTTDSNSNVGEGDSQNVHSLVEAKKEGPSKFTSEISTCGRDISYSRQLFADKEHGYSHQLRFDESSSSNFLDLDRISSSGNSCAEEIYERSSSENVITETTSNTTWEGSSDMVGAAVEFKQSTVDVQNSDIGEFSERFVCWVDYGGALWY